jgi:glycosyltransferase involved in cell wall biosynthesis
VRIVHIGTSQVPVLHRFGGALQRRMMEMARLQASAGHDVVILSPGARSRIDDVDGVTVCTLRLRSRRPIRDFEFLARARRWLNRNGRADVLHAHGAPAAASGLAGHFTRAVQSVDYFRYRASTTSWGRNYHAARLGAFDLNLAVSDYCAGEFARFYPGLAPTTRVLYNGVNRKQFRSDPPAARRTQAKLGLPQGPVVVYLGRFCEQKGSALLAPLATALRQRVPAATVVAAGPCGQFAQTGSSDLVKSFARAGGRYVGAIDESHVAGLLNSASVCVLPTRRDEMFGMAALEAVACGTPVVASDLGGIREAVGPCGLLFPVGDSSAFVDGVTDVLNDPHLAKALRERGPHHTERFDWASVVDDSMAYYAEILR